MLREDFLPDYGLSVTGLAGPLGVSRQTMNELSGERDAPAGRELVSKRVR